MPQGQETPESKRACDLTKLQFDYAWKWFSFHADQRLKMFNYMVIVFGILTAALVNAIGRLPPPVASVLCVLATVVALIFLVLDYRNRRLLELGEALLRELEDTQLFGDAKFRDKAAPLGIFERQTPDGDIWRDAKEGKHRIWLPAILVLISATYAAAAIVILVVASSSPPAS